MDQEGLEKWIQLAEKADQIADVWIKIRDPELSKTFKIWYLRVIKEMSEIKYWLG